ncbi:MAG: class IIb bacteriocin, lactobin A/cerein 7B family [Propionibacteriaceae bacterium]|nr:class IIb bacteriocin, lactobin A/cerein 7B family [Propionibacteriaceae bacterium]
MSDQFVELSESELMDVDGGLVCCLLGLALAAAAVTIVAPVVVSAFSGILGNVPSLLNSIGISGGTITW